MTQGSNFATLRGYQRDGVQFLAARDSGLLADEMGLGKTVQAALALERVLQSPGARRAIIVTPASLIRNWSDELQRWTPTLTVRVVRGAQKERIAWYSLPVPVLLTTYEQLRIDIHTMPSELHFDVALLDEAQRIKNADATTSMACKLLPRRRSWALTGTPVENSAEDLISLFSFLRFGLLQSGMPKRLVHEKMRPFFLRRTKAEVLAELPPIIVQELPLELGREQQAAYDTIWNQRDALAAEGGRPVSEVHLFSIITRLKQICNRDVDSGESAKLDALRVILESSTAVTDKVIVFSQFVETLRWLYERIKGAHVTLFHGGQSLEERAKIVADFESKGGPGVLLMSLKAGGVGINLNSASTVVLFDRWWNPAVEEQAIQRAHRFGRERPLHVFKFIVEDTIEERINEVLQEKTALFRDYVAEATSADTAAITRDDLRRMLDLGVHDTE